eukprot:Seg3311.2 transcript_id=Seg3311.2/GoldUCD/mRNA.D3Y31 product="Dopamine D2-like receptor" protein_id=Seg3311.2/GoldUCD/D3Y31
MDVAYNTSPTTIIQNGTLNMQLFDICRELQHFLSTWVHVILIIIAILIFISNLTVLLILILYKRARPQGSVYIANLILSDLLFSLFAIPFQLHQNSLVNQVYNAYDTELCSASIFCYIFAIIGSAINVVMVTLDRYIAVTRPFQYKEILTTTRIVVVISFIWTFKLIGSIIGALTAQISSVVANRSCFLHHVLHRNFVIFLCVLFIAAFVLLVVAYAVIVKEVRNNLRRTRPTIQGRFDRPATPNLLEKPEIELVAKVLRTNQMRQVSPKLEKANASMKKRRASKARELVKAISQKVDDVDAKEDGIIEKAGTHDFLTENSVAFIGDQPLTRIRHCSFDCLDVNRFSEDSILENAQMEDCLPRQRNITFMANWDQVFQRRSKKKSLRRSINNKKSASEQNLNRSTEMGFVNRLQRTLHTPKIRRKTGSQKRSKRKSNEKLETYMQRVQEANFAPVNQNSATHQQFEGMPTEHGQLPNKMNDQNETNTSAEEDLQATKLPNQNNSNAHKRKLSLRALSLLVRATNMKRTQSHVRPKSPELENESTSSKHYYIEAQEAMFSCSRRNSWANIYFTKLKCPLGNVIFENELLESRNKVEQECGTDLPSRFDSPPISSFARQQSSQWRDSRNSGPASQQPSEERSFPKPVGGVSRLYDTALMITPSVLEPLDQELRISPTLRTHTIIQDSENVNINEYELKNRQTLNYRTSLSPKLYKKSDGNLRGDSGKVEETQVTKIKVNRQISSTRSNNESDRTATILNNKKEAVKFMPPIDKPGANLYPYWNREAERKASSQEVKITMVLSKRKRPDQKAIHAALTVLSLFILCWLPSVVAWLSHLSKNDTSVELEYFTQIAYICTTLSAALNPIIYVTRTQGFKLAIYNIKNKLSG